MDKSEFKKGTRFRIAPRPAEAADEDGGALAQGLLEDASVQVDPRVWVCVEASHRVVVALDEARALHRLRRHLGADDAVSTADVVARASTFDEFLVLWEKDFALCSAVVQRGPT